MIRVKVKIGREINEIEMEEDSSILDLLKKLGYSREEVLVLKNKEVVIEEEKLKDGDFIEIIRAISGGFFS